MKRVTAVIACIHHIAIMFDKMDQYLSLYLYILNTIGITPIFTLFVYANLQFWSMWVTHSQQIIKIDINQYEYIAKSSTNENSDQCILGFCTLGTLVLFEQ